MKKVTVLILALVLTSSAGACGKQRWAVKTLTDSAATQINFHPSLSTVHHLGTMKVPTITDRSHRQELEKHVYTVTATLVKVKYEADMDYHLVLKDGSSQMIAESPSPACTYKAQHRAEMKSARLAIDLIARGPIFSSWRYVNKRVRVTGVYFLDEPHGQTGMAPNASELHPILAIRALNG